jgi:hypothetical protein
MQHIYVFDILTKKYRSITYGEVRQALLADIAAQQGPGGYQTSSQQTYDNLPEGITKEEMQMMIEADLQRTMEGVIPRLPQIKILHAGALTFKFPDETKKDEFEGIIVDQHPCNAYWEKQFSDSGGGEPPTCSSLDGIVGSKQEEEVFVDSKGHKVFGKCATCYWNQFWTGKDGSGKACKNMKRLHILLQGEKLPFRLTLPPTSIISADEYFTSLFSKGFPVMSQLTQFGLEEAQSGAGIDYSKIRLQAVSQIDFADYIKIRRMVGTYLNQIRGQKIEAEEYYTEESEKPKDDIPF